MAEHGLPAALGISAVRTERKDRRHPPALIAQPGVPHRIHPAMNAVQAAAAGAALRGFGGYPEIAQLRQ